MSPHGNLIRDLPFPFLDMPECPDCRDKLGPTFLKPTSICPEHTGYFVDALGQWRDFRKSRGDNPDLCKCPWSPQTCPPATFDCKKDFEHHCRRFHGGIPCPECGKMLSSVEAYYTHLGFVHHPCIVRSLDERPPSTRCGLCKTGISNAGALRVHRRSHNTLQCPRCKEVCYSAQLLDDHHRLKHGVCECPDTECDFRSSRLTAVQEHFDRDHPSPRESYPCYLCTASFPGLPRLSEHFKIHVRARRPPNA